jgi:hypothetical protein
MIEKWLYIINKNKALLINPKITLSASKYNFTRKIYDKNIKRLTK